MFQADGSQPELNGRSLSDDVTDLRASLEEDDPFEHEIDLWHDMNHLGGRAAGGLGR